MRYNCFTTIYTWFLYVVLISVASCIPIKCITLGPRDPDFVTPLVKSSLVRRKKLCTKIAEYRTKRNGYLI